MKAQRDLTFELFLVNSTNINAYTDALRVSHNCTRRLPPACSQEKIAIIGPTSSGKSHLASAIINEYIEYFPNDSYAIYSSGEINDLLERETEKCKEIMNTHYNLMIIEDVDCINVNNISIFEDLVRIIYQNSDKLVITYTNKNKVSSILTNELSFFPCIINEQDSELYKQYLDKFAYAENLIMRADSKNYILLNYADDFRQLISALHKIAYQKEFGISVQGQILLLPTIKEILED